MRKNDLVDFHTHILPKMDDGARDVKTSVEMLKTLYDQGVTHCVLTPHYMNDSESVEHFIARREESYEALKKACQGQKIPKIALGAEVYLNKEISNDDLKPLCMGNSNIIMLEFPSSKFQYWMIDEIEHIAFEQNIDIMFAHVDRLLDYFTPSQLEQVFGFEDFIYQINNISLRSLKKRLAFYHYYSKEMPIVLGSDSHDIKHRAPDFSKSMRRIKCFPYGNRIKRSVEATSEILLKEIFD